MVVGDTYNTNRWGDVIVTEYKNNKQVLVRFLNTGNEIYVQKNALQNGLLRDVAEESRLAQEKEASRLSKQVFRKLVSHLFKLCNDYRGWMSDYKKYLKMERHKKYKNKFFAKRKLLSKRHVRAKAREHYDKNRAYRIQQAKDYQKNNPEKTRVRNRNRRARRIQAEGYHTLEETNQLLVSQNNRCVSCNTGLDDTKHLDHVLPLAKGGSNWISNLQWLCAWCNLVKNDKHPDEWAYEISTPEFQQRLQTRDIVQ